MTHLNGIPGQPCVLLRQDEEAVCRAGGPPAPLQVGTSKNSLLLQRLVGTGRRRNRGNLRPSSVPPTPCPGLHLTQQPDFTHCQC